MAQAVLVFYAINKKSLKVERYDLHERNKLVHVTAEDPNEPHVVLDGKKGAVPYLFSLGLIEVTPVATDEAAKVRAAMEAKALKLKSPPP